MYTPDPGNNTDPERTEGSGQAVFCITISGLAWPPASTMAGRAYVIQRNRGDIRYQPGFAG